MPLVVTSVGAILLLRSTDVVDSLAVAGPVLLMLVGLLVIFGRGMNQRVVATADRVNSFNVFSGSEVASRSDHFEGGSVGALFGAPKSICVMRSRPRARSWMSSSPLVEQRSRYLKGGK
jgi:hypothetical protein